MIIKRANLFYQDMNNETISFLNIRKIDILYNDKINNDVITSDGEIFNIPFSVTWKQDSNKQEQLTNLKFKKIKLNIINSTKYIDQKLKNAIVSKSDILIP